MKTVLALLCLVALTIVHAQPVTPSRVSLTLELNSANGTNGCAVAWNPDKKLYYSIIAGNADFPIDVFDSNGKWLKTVASGIDDRGIWYNPKSKKLEGRSYGAELSEWSMNSDGTPSESNVIKSGLGPEDQFVVTSFKGYFYYHDNGVVKKISSKGKTTTIQLARPSGNDDYNLYTMGFTGVKNYEIVLLKPSSKTLEFYNLKGKLTSSVVLPGEIPEVDAFRFGFANNMAWLYDIGERTWSGYKVF